MVCEGEGGSGSGSGSGSGDGMGGGCGECTYCQAGSQANDNQDGCDPCDFGMYAPFEGSICLPCERGTFSSESGSWDCEPCPAGTVASKPGLSECSPCPINTVSVDGIRCEGCGPGQASRCYAEGKRRLSDAVSSEGKSDSVRLGSPSNDSTDVTEDVETLVVEDS